MVFPLRAVAGLAALAYGFGALSVAERASGFSTYVGSFPLAGTLMHATGLALVAAGVATRGRIGALAIVAGYLWFAPLWVGWEGGPPLVRSLGMIAESLIFPVLLHIVLGSARLLVIAVYIEAIASAAALALFRDPFFDPYCWANCIDNVVLVKSLPGVAQLVQRTDLVVRTAAAVALAGVLIWRLVRSSRSARRALWPTLPGGFLLAVATVWHAGALARTPLENPAQTDFRAAFVVGCAAGFLVAAAVPWSALRTRAQRRAVSRIVADLGDAPAVGSLRSALRHTVGDPNLDIVYWLPTTRRYVDAHGRHADTPNGSTAKQAMTTLVRNGQTIAVVIHASGVELSKQFGAAARLALENERLQAEILAQLDDLKASRTRIVETGDAHRQRLERDLHDGAQQDLLALLFELRLARSRTRSSGDIVAEALLVEAEQTVQAAIDELRELARGIYPAVLTQAGLGPALEMLADNATIPVELDQVTDQRYSIQVEVTAYLVIAEAIDDASRRGVTYTAVCISREDECIVIEISDDGTSRGPALVHLEDRIGALGGKLEVGPGGLRAVIPCV